MKTTVYLVRHSIPFKEHLGINNVNESILFSNIKTPLSVDGEKLAEKVSNYKEFSSLDVVWSSNYVRAMSTAKYFAFKNNLKVNVSEKFGERKHGITSWSELPNDFEIHQFQDENYKIGNGESQKETSNRLYQALLEILDTYRGKRILIVGHSTAFAYLLGKWCEISYDSDYKFNNQVFFDGKWNYCQIFKLVFDDYNNLVNIENIGDKNGIKNN